VTGEVLLKNGGSDAQLVALVRTVHDDSLAAAARDTALRRFLAWLGRWGPRYLSSVFAGGRDPSLDDDAIQHLAVAVLEHRTPAFERDDHVLAWCKTVLRNFQLSELRLRKRNPPSTVGALERLSVWPADSAVESRISAFELVRLARMQIRPAGSVKSGRSGLAIFDWLVADVLDPPLGRRDDDRTRRNRWEQRRSRARRLARRALELARRESSASDELPPNNASQGRPGGRPSSGV
jgi:hypothetical protein